MVDFSEVSGIAGGFWGIFILFTGLYANLVKKIDKQAENYKPDTSKILL